MMFPSVWSSLLIVNRQALGTFVSLLIVILGGQRQVVTAAPQGAAAPTDAAREAAGEPRGQRTGFQVPPSRPQQGLCPAPRRRSLLLALEEQERLEGRRRVHPAAAAARPAVAMAPVTSLPLASGGDSAPWRAGGLGAGSLSRNVSSGATGDVIVDVTGDAMRTRATRGGRQPNRQ